MNLSDRMNAVPLGRKRNFSTLMRLVKHIKVYKLTLIAALSLTLLSNAFSLITPQLVERSVSFMELPSEQMELNVIFQFCFYMLAFYVASYILSMTLSYVMLKLGQNIGYKLRKDSFEKFDKLTVSYFDTHQTGDILSRFTYDIDLVSSSIGQSFMSFSTSIIILIGSLVLMISNNITLMTTFFVTIPLSIIFSAIFTTRARKYHREKSKRMGDLIGYIEDKITGHKTIKTYGQESNMLSRLKEKSDAWGKSHFNANFYGASFLRISLNLINNTTTAILYVHSCVLFLDGSISLAEISSFILYAKMFTGNVNELSFIMADLQSSLAAADRVFSFLDKEEEVHDKDDATTLQDFSGEVNIDDVCFSYNEKRKILQNVSINAKPNTITAIVGHTGAGKTSLINLLMRFYETDSGSINFDQSNITDITRKNLRSNCAMVLQDSWLFGGTIYENIVYGNENSTMEDVLNVTKAVSLHELITQLPDGYETLITENTFNISQGQKQLITIARAMLLNAKVLILDEATSNVDTLTELNVQNAMKQLMVGKTSFVIAHRLSTVQNADTILVLDKGQIIERGNHDELIELNGNYARLYNAQFDVLKNIKSA